MKKPVIILHVISVDFNLNPFKFSIVIKQVIRCKTLLDYFSTNFRQTNNLCHLKSLLQYVLSTIRTMRITDINFIFVKSKFYSSFC